MSEEKAIYVVNSMYRCGFDLAKTGKVKALPNDEGQAEEWYKGYLAGMHDRNKAKQSGS